MEIFDLGDFTFQSGVTLSATKLAYQTYGELNGNRDNAILFPTFLGAEPDALDRWIGQGRPLDPERYFIVLPGHFGLPPSTSPSNTGQPFDRGAFPAVHIADDVIAQHRLITERYGIRELQLVLGWSVGALQTYEWAVRFAPMVRRMACIAGAPKPSPWTRHWLHYALEEPLTSDPAWQGGFYPDRAHMQAAVRRMAHATALTLPPLGFYAEEDGVWRTLGFASPQDAVSRFFEAFWLPHDPNDIVAQARKARAADPAAGGDMASALGRVSAKALVVAFSRDFMFPPEESKRDADRIPVSTFEEVQSVFGHLATFALSEQDVKAVDALLRKHLAD
jgi:homoserine O-acetyltransferase/O-succinyltransferase